MSKTWPLVSSRAQWTFARIHSGASLAVDCAFHAITSDKKTCVLSGVFRPVVHWGSNWWTQRGLLCFWRVCGRTFSWRQSDLCYGSFSGNTGFKMLRIIKRVCFYEYIGVGQNTDFRNGSFLIYEVK